MTNNIEYLHVLICHLYYFSNEMSLYLLPTSQLDYWVILTTDSLVYLIIDSKDSKATENIYIALSFHSFPEAHEGSCLTLF